ncbi:MAG: hypothetical protein AAGH99_03925 [Planctomycetota bacterium]
MRRTVDIFVILCVVAVAVFVFRSRPSVEAEAHAVSAAEVQDDLARLYDRASYFGALEHSSQEQTKTLWPVAILPEWFGSNLPTNRLLPGVASTRRGKANAPARPWIDVAPPGDQSVHPPDPVAVRSDQAQFWYNPNVGIFRARVAAHLGEDEAVALYNQLNGVELEELHRDTNPARTPLAYTPGTLPSATLASREPQDRAEVTPQRAAAPAPTPTLFASDPAPAQAESEAPRPRGRARLKDQPR